MERHTRGGGKGAEEDDDDGEGGKEEEEDKLVDLDDKTGGDVDVIVSVV